MPVAIQLNNKSIAVTAESLLHFYEHPINGGKYQVSIAFSHDNWKTPLEREEEGPKDRINNLDRAAGPYISQLPSGEVIVSHTNQFSQFEYKIGDPTAHKFSNDYTFDIGVKNLWSMTEPLTAHRIACIADDGNNVVGSQNNTMSLGYTELVLNHDIFVNYSAHTSSWDVNTEALFVGAVSQAQASIRFSHDEDKLYVLSEVLDRCVTDKDFVTIYIKTNNGTFKFSCYSNGRLSADSDPSLTQSYINNDSDIDRAGYAIEFAIDKSVLGITKENNTFYVLPELNNADDNIAFEADTLTMANIMTDKPHNCPLIILLDK
jgi:hypothetical protein